MRGAEPTLALVMGPAARGDAGAPCGRPSGGGRGVDGGDVFADGGGEGCGELGAGGGEFRAEPGEESDEVVEDEDLTVASVTAADADGGDGEVAGDFGGEAGQDNFENGGEGSGFLDGVGVAAESVGLGRGASFDLVASFFEDVLGEHADVGEDGDARGGEGADLRGDGLAAFDFHADGPGFDDAASVLQGVCGGVVSGDGKVRDDGGAGGAAGDGAGVAEHVVEGHVGGVGVSEHDHAE